MTYPRQPLARAPLHAGEMMLFAEEGSTVVDSELTAAPSPSRSVHSDDATDGSNDNPLEGYARISGVGIDHANLTLPGFRPLGYLLTQEAAHYLVSEPRWSNQDDSDDTVGQKNSIIIFVSIATIEECLVDEKSGKLLPVTGPFQALVDALGMRVQPNGTRRNHKFLSAIRDAFVRSRCDEIKRQLALGNFSPTEPSDISGLGRMLLDVVDRHIAFLRTKNPMTRLRVPIPLEKVLSLRLIQIKNQLRNKECIEKCFTTFLPTIPAHQKTSWPRSGLVTAWEAAQAKHNFKPSNAALGPNRRKHQDNDRNPISEASCDVENGPKENSDPNIPGNSVDEPIRHSQSAPAPSAWQPDALSGLQLFKAAVSQVHKAIGCSKDSINVREFINQIEVDVKEFHEMLQSQSVPARADSAGGPGPQVEVPLDPECIRSLMLIGLILIKQKWNEQNVTENSREKILGDVLEELRMIKEAADQVSSAHA